MTRVALKLLATALVIAAVLAPSIWSRNAHAQIRMQMQMKDVETSIDEDEIEVGDVIHLTLQVMSENGAPDHPDLGAHPGFSVTGPVVSPSQYYMNINGRTSSKRGINATWTLRAQREGTFTIGPPSANVAGAKIVSTAARVHVVKKGTLQRAPPDPWLGAFGRPMARPPPPEPDPLLAYDHDDTVPVFLHATLDKTDAVLGEQVTYIVALYIDPDIDDQNFISEHEAPASGFLRRTILSDDAPSPALGYGKVRSRVYRVKAIRKVALFPVQTGNLEVGSEEIRYPVGNRYLSAKSDPLHVRVTEPPTLGRPPGYALGDTGHFDLVASVSPREIDQGDAVGITVDLHGTGNVPRAALPMPLQADVAFMAPELSEKVGVVGTDRFSATDTFRYVARIDRPGDVDLGAVSLPYYDPDAKKYAVATAALGVIKVRPAQVDKPAPADPNPVVFPDMPPPKKELAGAPPAAAKHMTDAPWYWITLWGSPLAFGFIRGGAWAAARAKRRSKEKAADPERAVADRKREATAEDEASKSKELAAAVRKYVEASTLAFSGVNVRGESAARGVELLVEAGIAEADAKAARAILDECAALSFRPDDVPIAEARALFERAKTLDATLKKGRVT